MFCLTFGCVNGTLILCPVDAWFTTLVLMQIQEGEAQKWNNKNQVKTLVNIPFISHEYSYAHLRSFKWIWKNGYKAAQGSEVQQLRLKSFGRLDPPYSDTIVDCLFLFDLASNVHFILKENNQIKIHPIVTPIVTPIDLTLIIHPIKTPNLSK